MTDHRSVTHLSSALYTVLSLLSRLYESSISLVLFHHENTLRNDLPYMSVRV